MPDAAAFFDRYHLALYRYFLRMLSRADIAEDLTQEVFVRIVRSAPRYAAQGREEAWVFTIARVVLVEHMRGITRGPTLISLGEARDCALESSHVVAFGVREALDLLPQRDRELLLLRDLAGLSYQELSQVCGVPVGTVRTRMYRAREAVRRLLPKRASELRQEQEER
jgi:RNA polymerase sigma-70 factor (ECF subfamily)